MLIFVAFDGRPPTDDHALQSVALRKLCHAKIAKTHMGLREAFLCRVVEKARAELVLLAGVPQITQLMAQGQARSFLPIDAARNPNRDIPNVPSYFFINFSTPLPAFGFPMREFSGQ